MLAGTLLTFFFAWNVTFEELEVKCRDKPCLSDPTTFMSIAEERALTIKHSIFSEMAGLIVEMLFMLFSVYNALQWENE